MSEVKDIDGILDNISTDYDRTYIKSDIDVDKLLDQYIQGRKGEIPDANESDKDSEVDDYISKINEIVKEKPELARVPEGEQTPESMTDTKEFYKLGSVEKKPVVVDVDENKGRGKKARITSVKEFVQTTIDGVLEQDSDTIDKNKVFVVTIPQDEFDNGVKAGVIDLAGSEKRDTMTEELPLEDAFGESGEIDEKKLSRYLNDNFLSVIKNTIQKIKQENACYIHPFDREDDKKQVRKKLTQAVSTRRKNVFACAFAMLILAYLAITQTSSLLMIKPVSYLNGTMWFMIINVAVFLFIFAWSKDIYITAIKGLVCKKFTVEAAIATLSVLSLVHTIVLIFNCPTGVYTYLAVPALVSYFYELYSFELVKKLKTDYKLLSFKPEKTCGSVIEDEEVIERVLGDEETVAANVKKYDTIDTSDFFTKSMAPSGTSGVAAVISPISLIAEIAAFIYVISTGKGFVNALTAGVISMSVMVTCGLAVYCKLPYTSFSKKLKFSGAALVGAKSAEKFSKVESVIIDDSFLFPTKSLQLCGTKTYNQVDVKELIINVVSAIYPIKGPLSEMMFGVVDNRDELIKDADNVTYYDEKGISAYVDNNKILIGNEQLMRDNLIRMPKDNSAEKILKGGKVPLYISVNGVLSAIFAIKYTENPIVKRRIKKLISSGVSFAVKTRDPNLTRRFVSDKYDVPDNMLRILPVRLSEIEESMPAQKYTPDVITITKDVSAFFRAHTAANKMRIATTINTVICVMSFLVGIAATVMVCASPMFIESAKPIIVLLLHIAWMLPMGVFSFALKQNM